MPIYEYRCGEGHLSEQYFSIADYKNTIPCVCGEDAKRIYSSPFFSVEYVERQDFSQSLGRERGFNNKSELKSFMQKHNLKDGAPEDRAKAASWMKDAREMKADTGSYK